MTRHLLNTTLGSLAVVALPFLILGGSALGGEAAQTRIAWKGAAPQSEEIVKWVYEGCAAYPVTRAELAAAEAVTQQDPALLNKGVRPVGDVDTADQVQSTMITNGQ